MKLKPEEAKRLAGVLLADDEDEESSRGGDESSTGGSDGGGRLGPGRFGRYEIIRLVGIGGMGEVYEAQQDAPQRRVALKVIRPELVSPELRRRFEYESRTLGRLQHPSIAKVFDAGQADSVWGQTPYFAMEFVEGQPLIQFAIARKLGLRERLQLFLSVCDAVEHAHQSGVIHRDLKPGNILVDGQGRPRVLDFGMARVTDLDVRTTTLHTEVGKLVGTLPYMSPEQVAGDVEHVDTRSDVYSLGVVLYELLAERLPYEIKRGLVHEAARVIREEDPARLSSVSRTFRGDVETIVAKALEKEPGRRYQSVGELAADIRRYLSDEPIVARRAGTWYQVRKFGRRNRVFTVAAAATGLTLVGGSLVSGWFAVESKRSAIREHDARLLAEQRTGEAIRQAAIAKAAVRFLEDVFSAANPEVLQSPGATAEEILTIAADHARKRAAGDPEIEAALHFSVGSSFRRLGRFDLAEEHLRIAAELRKEIYGSDDPLTLEVLAEYANVLGERGDDERALEMNELVLEGRIRAFGLEHPDTDRTRGNRALVLMRLGRIEEAAPALEAMAARAQDEPLDDRMAIRALHNLAGLRFEQSRLDEAEQLAKLVLEARQRTRGEAHHTTLLTMGLLGGIYFEQQRYREAEEIARLALDVTEQTHGPEHPETLRCLFNLFGILLTEGRFDEASEITARLIEIAERTLGLPHPTSLDAHMCQIQLFSAADRAMDAKDHLDSLLVRFPTDMPRREYRVAMFRRFRGELLTRLDEFEAAQVDLLASFEHYSDTVGSGHPQTRHVAVALANLYARWGNEERAAYWRSIVDGDSP